MISKPCKRDGFSDSRTFPLKKAYCFREELLTYLNSHSELSQTSKMALFAKIVNGFHSSSIYRKTLDLGIWQGSEYVSDNLDNNNTKKIKFHEMNIHISSHTLVSMVYSHVKVLQLIPIIRQ